jgi:Cys-tRNA(Pro)/Cys-tRNA(Cys) deacylase
MTPAVNLLKKKKITHSLHSFEHDPNSRNFGMEAANALNLDPKCVFKTLLFSLNGAAKQLAVAIVPVDSSLNLKLAAKAAGVKKAEMAEPTIAQAVTGYLVGGISPIAQKKALPTFIDDSALDLKQILVSGGKRGLDIQLSPQDLAAVTRARFMPLKQSD